LRQQVVGDSYLEIRKLRLGRLELLLRLEQLRLDGMTLVFSSHRMDDVAQICENVTVMGAGRDVANGPIGRIFSDAQVMADSGLELPTVARTAAALRARGWPVDAEVTRIDDLVAAVEAAQRMRQP
jgi:ABC-type uncharacterized transport system ATPase subunit